MSVPVRLLIDATRCPVKAEIYRLAARHGVPVVLVSAQDIGAPFEPWLTKVVTGDNGVAETILSEASPVDVVISDDEQMATKLHARHTLVLTTRGQRWSEEGPQPWLPEKSLNHYRSRFETVLDDELRERLRVKI
jgi:uncharacterized protein YaiI (UPF0178 family)